MNLSNNEVKVMRILWTAGRAVSRREMLSLNTDSSWDTRTMHVLLNNLMEKGAAREAGYVMYGKNLSRLYEAVISYGDYCLDVLAPVSEILDYGALVRAVVNNTKIDGDTIEKIKAQINDARNKRIQQ